MRVSKTTILLITGLALLVLAMAACGPAQDPEDEAATATAQAEGVPTAEQEEETQSVEESAAEETPAADQESEPVDAPEGDFDIYGGLGEDAFETTETGLQYAIIEKGDGGKRPEPGQVVAVHYTGWLEDGTSFDSSRDTGQPISFPLGQGMVIAGWDEGIAFLEQGDSARLIIPGDLAYGEVGRQGIPPNATLIFDVELVSISEGGPEAPTEVDEADYVVTDSGLQYFDMTVGDGDSPADGLVATMHFTIWLEDGTKLGSTLDTGQPIPAQIGSQQMFPGWEEGLMGMRVGGSRQLVIPPELAFGETGTPDGTIPPDTILIIEIELLDLFDPAQ